MQNTNLTPRSKANIHGNIIVKTEHAHLFNEDENTESPKRHIDPYTVSVSNIHGQHRIPRYALDNLDSNSPRSMQANAERSQLEREHSYQKHLKSRLDSKFSSHERTLSRLSISIANQSEAAHRRSKAYNNTLVDSLDTGMLHDSLDAHADNMTLDIGELDTETNAAAAASSRVQGQQFNKPDSAVVSDYGYGPIDDTPIVDDSMAALARAGESFDAGDVYGRGGEDEDDEEDNGHTAGLDEPAVVKRSSPESTRFTRGGHAWVNKEQEQPSQTREESRLYKAQQERLFLEEQVAMKQQQLRRMQHDSDSGHRRQLEHIAKTMDSHLLTTDGQQVSNATGHYPEGRGQPKPLPRRSYEGQTGAGDFNVKPAAKSIAVNGPGDFEERRGLVRPYARNAVVVQHSSSNVKAMPATGAMYDPASMENAAAWQTRVANHAESPRSLGVNRGQSTAMANQHAPAKKNAPVTQTLPKTDFIAKNKDGRRTPKSYRKMAGRRRPTITDKDSMSNVASAVSSANTVTSKAANFQTAAFKGLPHDSGVTRARNWCPQVPQGHGEMWSADVDLGLVADRMHDADVNQRLGHAPNHASNVNHAPGYHDNHAPQYRRPADNNAAEYAHQISHDSWQSYDYSQHYRVGSDCNTLSTQGGRHNQDESPNTSGSPYRILPPIGYEPMNPDARMDDAARWRSTGELCKSSEQANEANTSPVAQHRQRLPSKDDGYAAKYNSKKDCKKNTYKKYTLDDYKKLKGDIKLGGLGADLENANKREMRGKHQKKVEYARKVQNQNSKQLVLAKSKPSDVSENNIADDGTPIDPVLPTKRQMALKYAQNVPKPKIVQRIKNINNNENTSSSIISETIIPLDQNIAELQRRHEQDRLEAELIRRQNSFTSTSNNQQTLSSEA